MSWNLHGTPMNLNKSVWYYNPKDIFKPKVKEQIKRDDNLVQRLISDEQVFKMSTLCFEECVQSFDSAVLSADEGRCLISCKAQLRPILTDLNLL